MSGWALDFRKRNRTNRTNVYSILFHTSEDRIGDALIKLPAILGLKQCRPDIRLIWTTGVRSSAYAHALAPLVACAIDEIYEISELGTRWRNRPHPLLNRQFDCVIVSDRKLRSTLALKAVPHRRFIAPIAYFLFSDKKPKRPFAAAIAEQTRMLFELAIDAPIALITTLPIPEHELIRARRALPSGPFYIGFAPGAGGSDKCWPLEHYLNVAQTQIARGRTPVFFLGPQERQWLVPIRNSVPGALFPEYDTDGNARGSAVFTIALASRLKLSVANDSGAGHLLAAGGQPIVSLFGQTNPEKFKPPYNQRVIIQATEFGSDQLPAIPISRVISEIDAFCAHYDE